MQRVISFFTSLVDNVFVLVLALGVGIILAATLAGANATLKSPAPQASPHVRLAPRSLHVNVGDTFSTYVLIDNATHLGAYEFKLRYDPSVVQILDMSAGEFLASRGDQVYSVDPRINNEVGELAFASLILGIGQNPDAGAQGSGKLATVNMKAVGEGSTTLDLQGIHLIDSSQRSQVPASIAGSVVVVGLPGSPVATAVPPTPYVIPTLTPRVSQLISTDPRETQLTSEGFVFLPVWSPDGSKIAFQRDTGIRHPYTKDYLSEVWVMNADGSGQRKIADNGLYPRFSADSRRLLYVTSIDESRSEVWVADVDGQDQRRVVDSDGAARHATWLPDGSIAFTQGERFKILDTAGRVRIISDNVKLTGNASLNSYRFSPDGSKIAYHQDRVLRVMIANGDHLATITTDLDPSFTSYAWSPDSQKLVYVTGHGGPLPELWVANADGTAPKLVVSGNREHIESPVWSPDGTAIAFTRRQTGSQTAETSEIYFVHPDGSGLQRVTNNNLNEGVMAWSPDGSKIAFTRWEMGTSEPLSQTIWVIKIR